MLSIQNDKKPEIPLVNLGLIKFNKLLFRAKCIASHYFLNQLKLLSEHWLYYWYGHKLSRWRSNLPPPPKKWKLNYRLCPIFSHHFLKPREWNTRFPEIFVKYFNFARFFFIWHRGAYALKAIKQSTKFNDDDDEGLLASRSYPLRNSQQLPPSPKNRLHMACTYLQSHTAKVIFTIIQVFDCCSILIGIAFE